MRILRSSGLRRYLVDLLFVTGLAALAWYVAGDYVRSSLFVWGDHPGQFMRFWYPLAVSLPQFGRIVDWNPLWYAGYPELQFYPPGHALVGLLLNALTLGRLSPEQVYNLIPATALALPGFTSFAFLRVALAPLGRWASRLAGAAAAVMTLSFTPLWGGTNAVPIGLMGERLAFGLVPLALLAGWKLVEAPTVQRLALAALAIATLILMHPFHVPAVVIAVAGYALARNGLRHRRSLRPNQRDDRQRWPWLAASLFLATGLVAWWLLPLLVRQTPYAAVLVRANLDQTIDWLELSPPPRLVLATLPALTLLFHRDWRVGATAIVLALLMPILAIFILFDYVVLVNRLGIVTLDPIRFVAEYYLARLLLAGVAVGTVCSTFVWRRPLLGVGLGLFLLLNIAPTAALAWEDVRARSSVPWQSTKEGLLSHPAFAGLWDILRQDEAADGRVLFTSYYTQITWSDGVMVPSAIKAMTPYFTGREILGGTFSHWSPVARLLWVGQPWRKLLPERVELEDDQRLLGISWEQMDEATLYELARAFNITHVVADADDVNARAALDRLSHFERSWDNGHFFVYRVRDNPPSWVETQGAVAELVERRARRWIVRVEHAELGATLTAKMAFYPLWHAEISGRALPLVADRYARPEIALPQGGPYVVTLVYREGWPEWCGLLITLISVAVTGLLLLGPALFRSIKRTIPLLQTAPNPPAPCPEIGRPTCSRGARPCAPTFSSAVAPGAACDICPENRT